MVKLMTDFEETNEERARAIADVRAGRRMVHINPDNGKHYVLDSKNHRWELTAEEVNEFDRPGWRS